MLYNNPYFREFVIDTMKTKIKRSEEIQHVYRNDAIYTQTLLFPCLFQCIVPYLSYCNILNTTEMSKKSQMFRASIAKGLRNIQTAYRVFS